MQRTLTLGVLVVCAATCVAVTLGRRGASVEPIAWYGPAPHPYVNEVRAGVDAFAADHARLGVLRTLGQEWTQDNENANVESLATRGHRGFAIYPADPAGANGLFRALRERGGFVIAYGAEPSLPTPATFTVATDVGAAADAAAERLIRAMGGRGNVVNVLESVTDVNSLKRKAGVEAAVARHPDVRIIQTIADVPTVADALNKIQSVLAARGDEVDGIVCTGFNPSVAAASALAEWRRDPSRRPIRAVTIDTDARVLAAIRAGDLDATVAQNPYAHGYLSCAILAKLLEGWTPREPYRFIDSGIVIVDRANVETFDAQVKQRTAALLTDLERRHLLPPKP